MPRSKKKTEPTWEQQEVRDAFLSCRQLTNDKIATTLAELAHREDITREQAKRITELIQTVTTNSFSLVMGNKGF